MRTSYGASGEVELGSSVEGEVCSLGRLTPEEPEAVPLNSAQPRGPLVHLDWEGILDCDMEWAHWSRKV
jgi:hypothetical protein